MEKIEIARRELGAALQLFLDDKCPVSVHVLASAGVTVTGLRVTVGYGDTLPNPQTHLTYHHNRNQRRSSIIPQ